MSNKKQYILAVPNFSEGADKQNVEKIIGTIRDIPGLKLVGVEPEADFNRTVVTMIGEPDVIKEALLTLGKAAVANIDMSKQQGTHPRIGAEDTLPIFPLKNVTLEECVHLSKEIGTEFHEATGVPVYFCGACASNDDRSSYAYVRKGQYEGLRQLLIDTKDDPNRQDEYEARKPDLSQDGLLNEKSGATICSAEQTGLTAYNIFLDTEDVAVAKALAKAVRGPSGGFTSIRAVGIKFPEHRGVVVSMNMFDCVNLPITRLYDFVVREAQRYGVNVIGSELVGPLKLEAIVSAFKHSLNLENFSEEQILEWHLMDM